MAGILLLLEVLLASQIAVIIINFNDSNKINDSNLDGYLQGKECRPSNIIEFVINNILKMIFLCFDTTQ